MRAVNVPADPTSSRPAARRAWGGRILTFLGRAGATLGVLWAAAALRVDAPVAPALAAGLALGCLVLGLGLALALRPTWRGIAAALALVAVVAGWWLAIPARNDRDWQADVARPARATFDGSRVTIENVRNFTYRSETDFDAVWETRTHDLDQITGLDLFISYWGPRLYAHTIASWEFADGRHLAISIETRKEKGESYSALLGFFRRYELYYVVADERDVIGVRADRRGEQVFLYRLRAPPPLARALLVRYLEEIDRLADRPAWYNAFRHNCTTRIRQHVEQVVTGYRFDWRILVNGHLDEMAYENGSLNTALPFSELRARSDITVRARAAGDDPAFSRLIREGLPARPPR
jgi:hypothetical protein